MSDFYYRPVRNGGNEENKPQKNRFHRAKNWLQQLANFRGFHHLKRITNPFKVPRGGHKFTPKEIAIRIGVGILALFGAGFVLLTLAIGILSIGLPDVKDLENLAVAQSTTIYDREGNILYTKHGGENREYVEINKISQNLINATVAMEDDRFWEHTGFDAVGILRAVFGQVTGNSRGGGSTITQQYVKNAFLSPEKSYIRKIRELILAVRLEKEFSKEKILELYLNKIPYGNNAYGVQKAAEIYFDKRAADLTLAESAILAALPQAPSYYNPYGEHRFSQLAAEIDEKNMANRDIRSETDLRDEEFLRGVIGKEVRIGEHDVYIQGRSDLVLKAMQNVGYITAAEQEQTLAEIRDIVFNEYKEKISAPHFVFYILSQIEKKYGKEVVEQGGLKVYTTIDPKFQEYAVTAVETQAVRNLETYNVKNAGLVSIDPSTGEILAMVGSKNYFAEDIDGMWNMITAYRQPGSSFKPIVYAEAFYNRHAPGSIVFDARTAFSASYSPDNYSGTFQGPVSIRRALGQSLNIPAIKAYYLAGEQKSVIARAQKMGIDFKYPDTEYGATLGIGTAEVSPLSMASAFGVFANGGIRHEPVAILKIENSQGEILEEWKAEQLKGEEALDPQIAYLITSILSDKSVGLGENLNVPGKITAAKTGTSNSDPEKGSTKIYPRDLWTVGYSPNLVTAVWSGNNDETKDGKPYNNADGYSNSAPIWKNFMTQALSERPSEDFERPEGIKEVQISKRSGLLPGPDTLESDIITEIFASFSVPTDIDSAGQKVKVDTRNNLLADKTCPEDFVIEKLFVYLQDIAPYENWQQGADAWMMANAEKTRAEAPESFVMYGPPPTEKSNLCNEGRAKDRPRVRFTNLKEGDHILAGINFDVFIDIDAKNTVSRAEFYLDDRLNLRTENSPYTGQIRLPRGEEGTQEHTISVKVFDIFGYAGEDSITITTSPNGKRPSELEDDDEDTDPPDPEEKKSSNNNNNNDDRDLTESILNPDAIFSEELPTI